MDIVFLIRSLNRGGAERQLVLLASLLAKQGYLVKVLVFYPQGDLIAELTNVGVEVISLNKSGRWDLIGFYYRLLLMIRRLNPKLLHAYLPVANVLAVLVKPWTKAKIIWGVRASYMALAEYGCLERWSYRLESWLSTFADLVIANSVAGKTHALQKGFKANIEVVANGIDTDRFYQNTEWRLALRQQWQLPTDCLLVGLIGRVEPIKGVIDFIQAAALLKLAKVKFVVIGGVAAVDYYQQCQQLVQQLGLNNDFLWKPAQKNMPAVYNALDSVCSTSLGEGFSNTIAEAMACQLPCVVTDVGDSAMIVGNNKQVVPAANPTLFAQTLKQLLLLPLQQRKTMGWQARQRIIEHYSLASLLDRSKAVLGL